MQNVRRYYNAVVRDLNTKIAQFPSSIIAGMFNFKPREFFEISAPAEREVPKVSFGGLCSADSAMAALRRAIAVGLLAVVAAMPAVARQLVIRNFNEQVTVNPDGTIEVIEFIEAHFTGKWNGLYRTIPVEYTTPQGLNFTLFLEPLSVTDDDARPLELSRAARGATSNSRCTCPARKMRRALSCCTTACAMRCASWRITTNSTGT